jgi:hypothetical protein
MLFAGPGPEARSDGEPRRQPQGTAGILDPVFNVGLLQVKSDSVGAEEGHIL